MNFLWTDSLTQPCFPSLDGDKQTDVLIIGGGMAGVLCAYFLERNNVNYILVEGERIGHGITKGTTAVITPQHDTLYSSMIKKHGRETAQLYLEANLNGLSTYRELAKEIDCDFEEMPSVMFSLNDRQKMEDETSAIRSLGFDTEFITRTCMPFSVAGAVRFPHMGQFHPLKFIYGISKNLNIYERTYVKKLDGTVAMTDGGIIHAKKVIVATHFPLINKHGMYFMKLYQRRSHVIALENAPHIGCTIEDEAKNGFFMRNYKNLLLIGGCNHRTGADKGGFTSVREFARTYYPDAVEKYAWANQDCVTLDGLPYIGSYSKNMPNVYVASGFNLWGMTTSMVAAFVLCDLVTEKSNRYAPIFRTDRSMLTGQLFLNLGTTLMDFVIPTTKRCPHMGCALKWNPAEHTWDCPCHGSRFDEHGELIDGPAMKNGDV